MLAFNLSGCLDEDVIYRLFDSIKEFQEIFQTLDKEEFQKEDIGQILFIIRDFSLKLENSLHEPITEQQYLEQFLDFESEQSSDNFLANKAKRAISDFAEKRNLITLPRPVDSEGESTEGISSISTLRPVFQKKLDKMRNFVIQEIQIKTKKGIRLDGPMLSEYLTLLIN